MATYAMAFAIVKSRGGVGRAASYCFSYIAKRLPAPRAELRSLPSDPSLV